MKRLLIAACVLCLFGGCWLVSPPQPDPWELFARDVLELVRDAVDAD